MGQNLEMGVWTNFTSSLVRWQALLSKLLVSCISSWRLDAVYLLCIPDHGNATSRYFVDSFASPPVWKGTNRHWKSSSTVPIPPKISWQGSMRPTRSGGIRHTSSSSDGGIQEISSADTKGDRGFAETDSQISTADQLAYWARISADENGMLGGYPQVSRIDLRSSRNFLRKLLRIPNKHSNISGSTAEYAFRYCLEPGAGIGRVTLNLLSSLCERIDIVEPIEKFTAVLTAADSPLVKSGQLRRVYNVPLQEWTPHSVPSYRAPPEPEEDGRQSLASGEEFEGVYDLIYNQWCLNHLPMPALVRYFGSLIPLLAPGGWIIVKENLSTAAYEADIFDGEDSSVTRSDTNWRLSFEKAGLRLVRTELQTGFLKEWGLLPVRMYALRPMEQ